MYIFLILSLIIPIQSFAKVYDPFFTENGINALNEEYKKQFLILGPDLEKRVKAEIMQAALEAMSKKGKIKLRKVKEVSINLTHNPIGIKYISPESGEFRFPLQGNYDFKIKLKIKVKKGRWFSNTDDYTFKIKNFSFIMKMKIIELEDGLVKLVIDQRPQLFYRITINADEIINQAFVKTITPIVRRKLSRKINQVIYKFFGQLTEISESSELPYGKVEKLIPQTTESNEKLVNNIDKKIIRFNAPHGNIMSSIMSKKDNRSWRDIYLESPTENIQGIPVDYPSQGDTAIWTGHYLAGLSFKYQIKKDKQSLKQIDHVLTGVENLLEINNNTGLLARSAVPLNSIAGKFLVNKGEIYTRKEIREETWVGYQADNGISRDQYAGVFFGLATAYDLVDDQEIKTRCKYLIGIMLDYIIRNKWTISEDRKSIAGTDGKTAPTFWAGINYQKITLLVLGDYLFPGKYQKELEEASALAESATLPIYLAILDPVTKYYKFNLELLNFYTYFRIEKNEYRKSYMLNSVKLLHRYLGHHKNLFHDIIRHSILKNDSKEDRDHMQALMNSFFKRSPRLVMPKDLELPEFDFHKITVMGKEHYITQTPLDPIYRKATRNFLWQKPMFKPIKANESNPFMEGHGVDASLTYWMGRYYKYFK